MRRCVWSRNLKNEEAMARAGPQRHRKQKSSRDSISDSFLYLLKYLDKTFNVCRLKRTYV